jgi:hypothetical protein
MFIFIGVNEEEFNASQSDDYEEYYILGYNAV